MLLQPVLCRSQGSLAASASGQTGCKGTLTPPPTCPVLEGRGDVCVGGLGGHAPQHIVLVAVRPPAAVPAGARLALEHRRVAAAPVLQRLDAAFLHLQIFQ